MNTSLHFQRIRRRSLGIAPFFALAGTAVVGEKFYVLTAARAPLE